MEFSGMSDIFVIYRDQRFDDCQKAKLTSSLVSLTVYFVIARWQPCMTQNWEININFKVTGKGKDLFGDGFAIWYARDRLVTGPVFGSKDNFMGLAIILDTYSNHNGPHNV